MYRKKTWKSFDLKIFWKVFDSLGACNSALWSLDYCIILQERIRYIKNMGIISELITFITYFCFEQYIHPKCNLVLTLFGMMQRLCTGVKLELVSLQIGVTSKSKWTCFLGNKRTNSLQKHRNSLRLKLQVSCQNTKKNSFC